MSVGILGAAATLILTVGVPGFSKPVKPGSSQRILTRSSERLWLKPRPKLKGLTKRVERSTGQMKGL